MFYHDTNHPSVLMYVDLIKEDNANYIISGWILHKEKVIKSILVNSSQIDFYCHQRLDVKQVYPYIPSTDVGFTFTLSKDDLYKSISVVLDDDSILDNIGTLEKWYIKHSSFGQINPEIIIVDNFYKDPDAVRNFAINNLSFNPSGYHKGYRTQRFILDGTKEKFENILNKKIINWEYPGYANGCFQFCVESDPIVYHVDQQMFAGIVFLTPDAPLDSGTLTFKSKKTGRFKYSKNEIDQKDFLSSFTDDTGNVNFYSNANLELVDRVANVYNRLVLFEARSIHAAEKYFGDTINNGRLFHIFFFDLES